MGPPPAYSPYPIERFDIEQAICQNERPRRPWKKSALGLALAIIIVVSIKSSGVVMAFYRAFMDVDTRIETPNTHEYAETPMNMPSGARPYVFNHHTFRLTNKRFTERTGYGFKKPKTTVDASTITTPDNTATPPDKSAIVLQDHYTTEKY